MSENQMLEQALEMLKQIQLEYKVQRDMLIKLETKFDSHQSELYTYKLKVEMLETKVNKAEGITGFLKIFAVFITASIISFGLWINEKLHQHDTDIIKISESKEMNKVSN